MLLGLSDLTASGLPEGPFSEYWSGQAGVRVAFFFGVTGLSFLLGPSSGGVRGSGWDGLKNRIVFSWGFLEMMVWFWVSFSNVPFVLCLIYGLFESGFLGGGLRRGIREQGQEAWI